jgi:hypothetical protein
MPRLLPEFYDFFGRLHIYELNHLTRGKNGCLMLQLEHVLSQLGS